MPPLLPSGFEHLGEQYYHPPRWTVILLLRLDALSMPRMPLQFRELSRVQAPPIAGVRAGGARPPKSLRKRPGRSGKVPLCHLDPDASNPSSSLPTCLHTSIPGGACGLQSRLDS